MIKSFSENDKKYMAKCKEVDFLATWSTGKGCEWTGVCLVFLLNIKIEGLSLQELRISLAECIVTTLGLKHVQQNNLIETMCLQGPEG